MTRSSRILTSSHQTRSLRIGKQPSAKQSVTVHPTVQYYQLIQDRFGGCPPLKSNPNFGPDFDPDLDHDLNPDLDPNLDLKPGLDLNSDPEAASPFSTCSDLDPNPDATGSTLKSSEPARRLFG